MKTPRQYGTGSRHDPAVVVFLSLYLLLVAFFVLLNSISQQVSTRAEDAMGSVNATFRAELPVVTHADTNAVTAGVGEGASGFHQDIRALFASQLPVAQLETDRRAGALRVTLPARALFRPDGAELAPAAGALLDGIADSVTQGSGGLRYEVELLLGSGRGLPAADAPELRDQLRRAGTFARQLRSLGAPAWSIATGLRPGDPELLQLSFYARDTARARLTFESLLVGQ